MRRRSLLAGVLAVAGCGLSERPYEQKRDWPLTAKNPQPRPAPARGPVLLIRTMQAGPGLETRGLRSLNTDGSVRSDFYETWAVLPAQGVEAAMREWLTADGQFAAVLAPGSRMTADYALETTLTEFIADPAKGMARAGMTLVVLETRGDRTQLRAQHTLSAEAPLAGSDAPAIAAALRAALEKLLASVQAALAGLSTPARPA
jgi:cholesterol transport system auxiliary component